MNALIVLLVDAGVAAPTGLRNPAWRLGRRLRCMCIVAIGADSSVLSPARQSTLVYAVKLSFILVAVTGLAASVVR
jgi:hypothetical protein